MAGTLTLTFGQRLRYAREQAGMKQSDLANILGVGRSTITNWETGGHAPAPLYRREIARLLGVEEDFLDLGIQTFTNSHTVRYVCSTQVRTGHRGGFTKLRKAAQDRVSFGRLIPT